MLKVNIQWSCWICIHLFVIWHYSCIWRRGIWSIPYTGLTAWGLHGKQLGHADTEDNKLTYKSSETSDNELLYSGLLSALTSSMNRRNSIMPLHGSFNASRCTHQHWVLTHLTQSRIICQTILPDSYCAVGWLRRINTRMLYVRSP